MTPVTQVHVPDPERADGHDADGIPGDCWRTAIACILDLHPSEVPHFIALFEGMDADEDDPLTEKFGPWWWRETRRWLRARGRDIGVHPEPVPPYVEDYVLLTGPSPRGDFMHVVVGDRYGKLVHDPHPSRMGLVGDPVESAAIVGLLDPPPPPWESKSLVIHV